MNSMVREALVWSVACTLPPVRFHMSQESTVPAIALPDAAASAAPGTLSRIQRILVPVKYGSMCRPVLRNTSGSAPAATSPSHMGPVLRSCQTIALHRGSPVSRSHTTAVSLWLVTANAAHSDGSTPGADSASRTASLQRFHISDGSCSTIPGSG